MEWGQPTLQIFISDFKLLTKNNTYMNTILKFLAVLTLSLGLFVIQSCVRDDDYTTPPVECPKVEANISIKDLKDKMSSKQLNLDDKGNIKDDLIVEGFVVSSDETGNIYKTLMLQNLATDGTDGIQFVSDLINLYTKYPLGSKIQIHLKGLKVSNDRGAIKIGSSVGDFDLNNLKKEEIESTIFKTCDPVVEIKPRVFTNIKDVLKAENINTLVTIEGVQFSQPEIDKTYAEKGVTKDRILQDKSGKEVILRNSGYAKWYNDNLPTGSGSITVVVSRYYSTWQLYIRDTKDVKFDQARFTVGGGTSSGGEGEPSANAVYLFAGADFENWQMFLNNITANGIKSYATHGIGNGVDNSNSLQIKGVPKANEYVVTVKAGASIPASPKAIYFKLKGTSTGKTLSINVNTTDNVTTGANPQKYYVFNLLNVTDSDIVLDYVQGNNYSGSIDTKGKWINVKLNIKDLPKLDLKNTINGLLSIKVGNSGVYDLQIDNIKID